LAWGCGLDSTGSGQGPVAGCCECGDEPSGSCATELVYQIPSYISSNKEKVSLSCKVCDVKETAWSMFRPSVVSACRNTNNKQKFCKCSFLLQT
jgi:hypothetical protein